MDPDGSPRPRAESETETDAQSVDPLERTAEANPPVFAPIAWIRRLFGWNSTLEADSEAPAGDPDALGPAFRSGSPAELAMVHNILRLRDLRVADVLTPRADVEAVAEDTSLEDVIQAFDEGGFSRMPVYRETLDDPLGFVHMKDLALGYGFGRNGKAEGFDLRNHIRPALFVPPSMRITSLLQKMQGERVHMALVIDEFGGVDGLITIEDLVEQIVGDIEDEHDAEDEHDNWVAENDGVFLVSARADIQEFSEAAGLDLVSEDWEEDVTSLGGLVFTLANRVPTRGEVILHPNGYEFEIVDADARRIKRMRVSRSDSTLPIRQAAE